MKNFFIVLLIIVIIAGTGYGVYYQIDNHNKNNNSSENANINEQNTETLSTLEKRVFISSIRNILGFYNNSEAIDETTNDNYFINMYYAGLLGKTKIIEKILNNNLSDNDKLAITLASLQSDKYYGTYEDMNFSKKEEFRGSYDNVDEYSVITLNNLNKAYKDLFGKEISAYEDVELFGYYSYFYDNVNNCYYKFEAPVGGTGNIVYYMYNNNFVKENDMVYVDTYLGYGEKADESKICTSFESINLEYSDSLNDCEVQDSSFDNSSFKIDESNYSKFKKYRFVFQKNSDGTYSFYKVEKD